MLKSMELPGPLHDFVCEMPLYLQDNLWFNPEFYMDYTFLHYRAGSNYTSMLGTHDYMSGFCRSREYIERKTAAFDKLLRRLTGGDC